MKAHLLNVTISAITFCSVTLIPVGSQAEDTKPKDSDKGGKQQPEETAAWSVSFPTFVKELSTIFVKNPTWPNKAPGLAFESTNDKNETVWLIPQMYPIPSVDGQAEASTSKFHGKTVTWDLKVDSIEEGNEGRVFVNFQREELSTAHPSLKDAEGIVGFSALMPVSQSDQARKLKAGQAVRIRGKISGEMGQGMLLFLGVGPNAGKIRLSISLSDAELVESKKP